MDDNSPYQASPLATAPQVQVQANRLPREITGPIKHMWVLGFVLAGFALTGTVILAVVMYRQFQHGDASLVMALFTVGSVLLDAVMFSGLSWGVRRRSRAAACVMLGYYLIGQALFLTQGLSFVAVRLAIITVVLIVFIRGARATFAYHRYRMREHSQSPRDRISDDPAR
jgi:hypothetical protein